MTDTATAQPIVAGGDIGWQPPIAGYFGSSFRLGEWLTGPVTPLFEDWALTRLEAAMHAWHFETVGQPAPLPHHVVINGWYFYSLAWLPVTAKALLRWAPRLLPRLLTQPRRVAPVIPPTAHLGIDLVEREWRSELLPRFRATSSGALAAVETAEVEALPGIIDAQLDAAGEFFGSITAVGGAAYKFEYQLSRFYRRHLEPRIGGSYLDLLVGLSPPAPPPAHAVETIDWAYPTRGERHDSDRAGGAGAGDGGTGAGDGGAGAGSSTLRARREEREAAARAALASSPRRAQQFAELLGRTQHLNLVREEQMRDFTRAWPAMRLGLAKLGTWLVERGSLEHVEDIYFLRRAELAAALDGTPSSTLPAVVGARRAALREAAGCVPPAYAGDLPWLFRRMLGLVTREVGSIGMSGPGISGIPVSPGTVTAPARIVLGSDGFDTLRPGEVLVAPTTAPAWTPLFASASGVVTDGGNAFSHASVVAREYGIPAVVGCVDATRRLSTGQRVTVDGTNGTVMLAH